MGYTQYWGVNRRPNEELLADVKSIISKAESQGIIIRGWDGNGEPEITTDRISFNGDEATNNDYETFMLDGSSSFCKTAEKPYDAVVCAVLLRFSHDDPSFKIGSDGIWDEEWKPGRQLYHDVFNEEAAKPKGL